MPHIITPAAEEVLDKTYRVLDKGFVRLVDYMGGDSRIVAAARTSYGDGTKTIREDRGLINYLAKNRHTSPFEQVELVFHAKWPLFVFAQVVRHRTANLNSQSARYSVMKNEFYIPTGAELRLQSTANKQVGEGHLSQDGQQKAKAIIDAAAMVDYNDYERLLDSSVGLAREQARIVLGQNLYTMCYWKIDLHNLLHFLGLRLDWHAQWETRQYAYPMYEMARLVAPLAVEAFDEHILFSRRFGRKELAALLQCIEPGVLVGVLAEQGFTKREADELSAKLKPVVIEPYALPAPIATPTDELVDEGVV